MEGDFVKKILWIIPICLITSGCFFSNKKLTCSIEETYDDIKTEITIVTNFKKGKAVSSSGKAIMTFENEEKAQEYYDAFDEDKSNLTLKGNKLIAITEQKFNKEDKAKDRNETIVYFENSGYKCK